MSTDDRDRVVRPSHERQPFTSSGVLKPEGPGPLPEGFLNAPDIEGLAWTRRRGDEWTTPEFRALVFEWIIWFFEARHWPVKWDVTEKARAEKSPLRLDEKDLYLRFGFSKVVDGEETRFEVAVSFPPDAREDNPDEMEKRLAAAAASLDAQYANS